MPKLHRPPSHWLGTASAFGTGLLASTFVRPYLKLDKSSIRPEEELPSLDMPAVDIEFLRYGITHWPEFVMVRGTLSVRLRSISYSAVLIRHPQATFLYDTGLCTNIRQYLRSQSILFRMTLARFHLLHTLTDHLQRLNLEPRDIDFVLLSHLHWDHVSGVPDIPGVPLRVNRIEYESALRGIVPTHDGLVWRLLRNNPVELFDVTGNPYAGFNTSLDLIGDGSVVLLPLPGHTPGNTGLLINRGNGERLFLIGDSAHLQESYLLPALPHPFFSLMATCDGKVALNTLRELHRFNRVHPDILLIPMHDADAQEAFSLNEAASLNHDLPNLR